ncbi:hypothetical protein CRD59_06680 [Bifidobacterium xylocopae]|uniref:DUF8175 domain-containing protein n=1 Tax=Bifidobacterium xylocopae TaxID=2493119 RepID=A0A366KB08_9BIFI|nr:hypothetical protein CRD59_06680 [Bifidobacterium xylocopae]
MLEADSRQATIDLAYQGSMNGSAVNLSIVYRLTWSQGDWKLRSEQTQPVSSSILSSFAGYTEWKEQD